MKFCVAFYESYLYVIYFLLTIFWKVTKLGPRKIEGIRPVGSHNFAKRKRGNYVSTNPTMNFLWKIVRRKIDEDMKRHGPGHLHPKLEVRGLTCPGWESNNLGWKASTLEKRHFEQLVNSYSEHLHMSAQPVENSHDMACSSACVTWTYMNTHEFHKDVGQISLARYQQSICQLPRHQALSRRTNCVRVTTMKWLDQGHLHPKPEVPGLTCPGNELNPGIHGGRRAL